MTGRESAIPIEIRIKETLDALRRGDAEAVLGNDVDTLPNELLTEDAVPTNPDWNWPSLAQSFALLFNGYEWCEEKGLEINRVFGNAEKTWTKREFDQHSLSELRCLLFILQRSYRDACGEPDPVFVADLLGAIREKVVSENI